MAIAVGAARFMFRLKNKRYGAKLFAQIPDALSLVLRAVRAGLPVGEAVRSLAREMPSPTREEFSRVSGEASIGVPIETAIWHLHRRTGIREYGFFAVTLGLQAQTGGNLAETLENLADMVRRRVAMVAKTRAVTAEARMSAMILGGLPFVAGGGIVLLSPGYIALLFTDRRGPYFIAAFVSLLVTGILAMNWLIKQSTQD
jgi:tight adherence protein B